MKIIHVYLFLAVAGLCSCAAHAPVSQYAPKTNHIIGYDYGYSESTVNDSIWQVSFAGNDATRVEVVERYALFRAAELTVEKGFDYFIIVEHENVETIMRHNPSSTPSTFRNPNGTMSKSGEDFFSKTAYTSVNTVQMFKGLPPPANAQAYNARTILKTIESTVIRGS